MDAEDTVFYSIMAIAVFMLAVFGHAAIDVAKHYEDFDLGSVVTTTAEYEYLTNDSFTGVVVRGEGWSDPALTVRNRDGTERRIATEFLEPME